MPSVLIKAKEKKILQIVPTVNEELVDEPDKSKGDYEVHYPLGVVTHAVGRVPNARVSGNSITFTESFYVVARININDLKRVRITKCIYI